MTNRPARALDVRPRVRGGLLTVTRGAEAYDLSPVASAIWVLSDGRRTVDAVAAEVAERFDAPPEVVRADVVEFLDELVEAGFMRWTD
jgi:hypothetical protein